MCRRVNNLMLLAVLCFTAGRLLGDTCTTDCSNINAWRGSTSSQCYKYSAVGMHDPKRCKSGYYVTSGTSTSTCNQDEEDALELWKCTTCSEICDNPTGSRELTEADGCTPTSITHDLYICQNVSS